MRAISASWPMGRPSRIQFGPMRRRSRPWPRSPVTWRSIRTRSRSKKSRESGMAWDQPALNPEDCQAEDQQHQEYHHEDVEQEPRDVSGSGRDAGEAEQSGDDRYHQKD